MNNLKTYDQFVVENFSMMESDSLNEGLFDITLPPVYTKIENLFKDPNLLNTQVSQAEVKAGTSDDNVPSKSIKPGVTTIVKLEDPRDNTKKSTLALTKLADLPDGSGLFQVTGSDSVDFLKSLNVNDIPTLNTVGVMAIVDPTGFVNDKPLTMRVYKNVVTTGKATVTQALVKTALNADSVASEKPVT